MKIYGYTIVDTLGFDDGTESCTKAFKTKEERDNAAYDVYEAEYNWTETELEQLDDGEEFLDKESFMYYFFEQGEAAILRYDSHFQIEPWEQEL